VHDFGGIIGFDYALAYPQHISQIVVLNSWLWSAEDDASYQKLKPILRSPLLPILYRWFNFSPAYLLPQSFSNKKKLTSHLKKHYTKPFSKPSERHGTLAFARSLLQDQAYFESLWTQVGKLRDKPALFIWGMQDTFITPTYLEKFTTAFPTHTVVRLAQCGHFPQEEAAEAVLEAIKAFV
jgi:haloalkane dehalogenase